METADAKKQRLGAEDALLLARQVSDVYVAKGKRTVHFNMKKTPPTDDELLQHLLGPTGNLRAPAVRKGKALLVGFDADTYKKVLA